MIHTGKTIITAHEPTVLIEGQPAVIAGQVAEADAPVLMSGQPTVLIAGRPTSTLDCQTTSVLRHVSGKPTVLIEDCPAANG